MKITLAWLAEFLDVSELFDLTDALRVGPEHGGVRQLVDAMNDLGMVVEGVEHAPASLDGVVVGQVVSLESIEGADKIRATLVDDGHGDPKSVVCGAWNFQVGDKVPWARPGVTLPTGMTLGERKMRGVVSLGMLCSPVEVGVSTEAGGLLILDPSTPVGVSFKEHFQLGDDVVFDLAIEANRPDANCVIGVARDLAAWLGVKFVAASPLRFPLRVEPDPVNDLEACDRLVVAKLSGVQSASFDLWRSRRLRLAGMRSISPVVDASNYVMLELGQPTHPYDVTRLAGETIAARFARPDEAVVTLDGSTRTLETTDVVIVDGDDRVAGLAGVMGGLATEVSAETVTVLIEAAHFPPSRIARTAKRLNARSEASGRFERGTDPEICAVAIERIASLANLTLVGSLSERVNAIASPVPIKVRAARVGAILGHEPVAEPLAVLAPGGPLARIGFVIEPSGEDFLVTPPSFRPDVTTEIEVIEEVARHFGYQRIASTPLVVTTTGGLTARQQLIRRLKSMLAGMGIFEAWSVTIVSPEEHEVAGGAFEPIALSDPLVANESELRQSVLAGLLRSLRVNLTRRATPIALFELGPVMLRTSDTSASLPDEHLRLGVLIEGGENGLMVIAPVVTALTRLFGLQDRLVAGPRDATPNNAVPNNAGPNNAGLNDTRRTGWPELHPGRVADLSLDGRVIGVVGELHPRQIPVELAHLVEGRFGYLEIDFEVLVESMQPLEDLVVPSVYTASTLDLSFSLAGQSPVAPLVDMVVAAGGELVRDVMIFDRFVRSDAPSISYLGIRLRLESDAGVIEEGVIQELIERIDQRASAVGAHLRRG